MNKSIPAIFAMAIGLIIGLYVILQILTSQGNAVGVLYRYMLPGAFVFGFLNPKNSVPILVVFAIYIDMGKKFLVAGENLYFLDLFFVLGIPSVMLLGACIARTVAMFFDFSGRGRELFPYFVATIVIVAGIGGGVVAFSGFSLGVLKQLANSAAYFGLIFLWPSIKQDSDEQRKLARFTLLAMIPAALYGLYHFFYGLNDFEWIYLESGFSRTASYAHDGEGIFGTFSSQGALSAVMMISCCICLGAFILKREDGKPYFNRLMGGLLFVLFFVTAVLSLKRGPLLILPLFLGVNFFIRTPVRTIIAYAAILATIFVLVSFGDPLADKLPDAQVKLNKMLGVEGETAQKITRIRTLNVRFREFASLGRAENWSAFGLLTEDDAGSVIHSKIVSSIFKLGFVPVSFLLVIFSIVALFLHRWIFRCVREKRLEIPFFVSLAAATVLPSFFGFGNPTTFPIPFFIGLFIAIAGELKLSHARKMRVNEEQVEDEEAVPLVYAKSS